MGDETNETPDPELLRQLEKRLNPTGAPLPPGSVPNVNSVDGTETEQHQPYTDPPRPTRT